MQHAEPPGKVATLEVPLKSAFMTLPFGRDGMI